MAKNQSNGTANEDFVMSGTPITAIDFAPPPASDDREAFNKKSFIHNTKKRAADTLDNANDEYIPFDDNAEDPPTLKQEPTTALPGLKLGQAPMPTPAILNTQLNNALADLNITRAELRNTQADLADIKAENERLKEQRDLNDTAMRQSLSSPDEQIKAIASLRLQNSELEKTVHSLRSQVGAKSREIRQLRGDVRGPS